VCVCVLARRALCGCSINFATGKTKVLSVAPIKIAHGVLMAVSWGILLPLGVIFARFYRHVEPNKGPRAVWFVAHQALQYSGVIIAAVGFIVAIYMERDASHFATTHAKLGLTVMCLGLTQPLNAFIRPHPGEKYRAIWSAWHKSAGYIAVLLAVATIFLGLNLIGAAVGFRVAYGVLSGGLIVFYLAKWALEVRQRERRLSRSSRPHSVALMRNPSGEDGSAKHVDYTALRNADGDEEA
jgi:hypothetical protein